MTKRILALRLSYNKRLRSYQSITLLKLTTDGHKPQPIETTQHYQFFVQQLYSVSTKKQSQHSVIKPQLNALIFESAYMIMSCTSPA